MPVELSIVIPAYNERERIGLSLEQIKAYCLEKHPLHEVIVIDDGSEDDTQSVVEQFCANWKELQCIRLERNRGKGFAIRSGILKASGNWILCTDADLSTPIVELEKLLFKAKDHLIVIGSRSIAGANIARRQPFHRVVMGRVFNHLVQALLVPGYADTQCGFKLYHKDAAQEIFSLLTIEGFGFDIESLFLARRLGYSVGEVPVTWYNDTRSKVRLVSDSAKMFCDIFSIRFRHQRVQPRAKQI